MSGQIHIRNWDKFQHYGDKRTPPWIKNYTELLSDEAYLTLTPNRRCLLHGLWLAYARSRRELSENTAIISSRLNMKVTRRDLKALSDAGFITLSASTPLASRYQNASPEVEKEGELQESALNKQPLLPSSNVSLDADNDINFDTPSQNGRAWQTDLDIQPIGQSLEEGRR